MLSKNRISFIVSLQKKKVREEERLYVIEGDKLVREFISGGIALRTLVAKPEFISTISTTDRHRIDEIVPATYDELKKVSTLRTPHNAMAIVQMPEPENEALPGENELSVALDCIQDPGNLGTIIRAAAWFGIRSVYCSPDSVDVYNPKVIQSTMGAILHVRVNYTDIRVMMESAFSKKIRIYGTVMDGNPVYSADLVNCGIILLGNESKGISDDLSPFITDRITIPKFTGNTNGIDSLNVGMAAAVVFSEFARRR